MPGDWWSRIGPGIAVASGVGYLVGAAALAEFARPLNVTAAELGIETRDYVTIAAVSALTALYLAAFVGAFLGTFLAIVSETGRTSRGQGLLRGPVSFIRDTAAGLTGLFFLAALFIAPTAYLAGRGDTSIYVVLLAGLTITAAFSLAIWLPARWSRERLRRRSLGRVAVSEGTTAVSSTIQWARAHPTNVTVVMVLLGCVLWTSAGITAHLYSKELLEVSRSNAPIPRPPLLIGLVVNPAWVCASSEQPSGLSPYRVVRVADSQRGAIILQEGHVWVSRTIGLTYRSAESCRSS